MSSQNPIPIDLTVKLNEIYPAGGRIECARLTARIWVDPPTDAEGGELVKVIAFRVIRYLKRQGYFQDEVDALASEQESTSL